MNSLRCHSIIRIAPQSHRLMVRQESGISYQDDDLKFIKSTKLKPLPKVPPARYGGRQVVTMLPGHGIGPEMMGYVTDLMKFIKAPIDFEILTDFVTSADVKYYITTVKRNGCCIQGIIEHKKLKTSDQLYNSPSVAIRKKLDLYANLNIIRAFKNRPCRFPGLDLIIIRQNTEGEFTMMEHENKAGVVESLKIITKYNSERIAEWAFRYANYYKRKKITVVHKAGILHLSDGLFLKSARKVSENYPDIILDDLNIDYCSLQMVKDPTQFDVLLCPNLYGSILLNIACGLIAGAGTVAASNYGDNYASFETATRSTGRSLIGLNKANPLSIIHAGVNLLNYLNLDPYADMIVEAIRRTVEDDGVATFDLGGGNSTTDVINRIKYNIIAIDREMYGEIEY